MKIVAISDLHGNLGFDVPECDLLLIGGDICPTPDRITLKYQTKYLFQASWLRSTFEPWLRKQPVYKTIATWGNHDAIGEKPDMVPQLPLEILFDSATTFNGLNIYGSPWQLRFCDWSFNLNEEELAEKWTKIPINTDIMVLHSPPYGYGDLADSYPQVRPVKEHVGSKSLLARIDEIKPKLVVFGHIHSGYGIYNFGNTKLVNASVLDESYQRTNNPIVIEL